MKASRTLWIVPVALLVGLLALPAWSYLEEFESVSNVNNGIPDHWPAASFPVMYHINTFNIGNNILDNNVRSAASVIVASFNTWLAAPNTTVAAVRGADTALVSPNGGNGPNVIAFTCGGNNCDFAKEPSTLAVTFTFPNAQGVISEADTFFNPSVCYTTDGNGTCPTAGQVPQDLQTVATHEIGHFFGLDHTGVVRAVMFPFAPPLQRTLSYDDVAGISSIYPGAGFAADTGKITGAVTLNGSPVFGAHVFAESTTDATPLGASVRKSPISNFTKPDGTYAIAGLPQDSYTVTAEPVDLPLSASDIDWGTTFNTAIQTNFTTRWH